MSTVLTRRLYTVGMALLALSMPALVTPHTAAASPTTGPNCVVEVSRPGASDPAEQTCYRTFSEAVAKATGGRVTNAPTDPRAAFGDRDLQKRLNVTMGTQKNPVAAGRALQGNVLLGIEYEHVSFGGGSRLFYGDRACTTTTSDAEWGFADLSSTGFNDVISSFVTYNNCWVDHYEHSGYAGAHTGYQPTQHSIANWMNDSTSSLIWS